MASQCLQHFPPRTELVEADGPGSTACSPPEPATADFSFLYWRGVRIFGVQAAFEGFASKCELRLTASACTNDFAQIVKETKIIRALEQSMARECAQRSEIDLVIGKNVTNSSALYVANAVDNP